MSLTSNMKINSERLWDSLMEMAKIGPGIAGGNNRQTLTDADGEGRHLFQRWCEAAGMSMGLDTMGKHDLVARRRDEKDRRNVVIQRTVKGALFVEKIGDLVVAQARALPR